MRGFTLIELMITILIAAILLVLGVPSFAYVTANIRMSNDIDALRGDIQFARTEAIKEGGAVTICASDSTYKNCSLSSNWATGWIVYSNSPNTPLRVRQALRGSETLTTDTGLSQVTFNRVGFPSGAPDTTFSLHSANNDTRLTRCLEITAVGQLTSSLYNPPTCS